MLGTTASSNGKPFFWYHYNTPSRFVKTDRAAFLPPKHTEVVTIFRGTTPTFTFKLPIAADTITKLAATFKQPGGATVEKTLADVTLDGQTVTATLTEEESLSFRAAGTMEIQLRVAVGETRMASQVWTVPVERILKEGAL